MGLMESLEEELNLRFSLIKIVKAYMQMELQVKTPFQLYVNN